MADDGQHHGERAHQQHERADRRERDVVELVRARARPAGRCLVEQVGGDQAAEEQALRAEEHPHRQLLVGDAGVGGVAVAVVADVGVGAGSSAAARRRRRSSGVSQRAQPPRRRRRVGVGGLGVGSAVVGAVAVAARGRRRGRGASGSSDGSMTQP